MSHPRHRVLLPFLLPLAVLFTTATLTPAARATPDESLVEVVMASDLQCPFCARAHNTIKQLRGEYGSKVSYRWLNQPLPFHQRAKPAAIAAEAARNQGKLDAFIDRVFQDYTALEDADLERYAREVGLDMGRFAADLKDPATTERVERDIRIANAVGATGTPTFFINGRPLRGAQPIEKFRELIDEELALMVFDTPRQHRLDRLKAENPSLFDYLHGNVAPPTEAKPDPTADKTVYKVTLDKGDPSLGDALAPVTMVVFGNYQCPFTRKLEPTLDALLAKYGGDLRLVFKQRPLPFHKSAPAAARAALCAHAQGKFEAMHDALLTAELIEGAEVELAASIGETIGLDVKKLRACMDNPKTQAKLDRDLELADKVGARGTPNAFVNGRKITGARPMAEFEALIDEQLAAARALRDGGVPAKALYGRIIAEGKSIEELPKDVSKIDQAGAARLGEAKAPIQVAIFADLQCPFSARAFPALAQIVERHPKKVSVTFHHFPLDFHQEARPAAELATCAAEQGRFWEVAVLLYEDTKATADKLETVAGMLSLDQAQLNACLESKRPASLIDRQKANATTIGVRGTPTLYINGRKWAPQGGYGVDALEATLEKHFAAQLR